MMRILLLVQQIASSVEPGIDNLDVNQDGANTCDNDVTVRHGRAAPCSKLDKVRILLSDLFIAAIFKEAAVSGNALILQYSFKAMNKTIEGIFHASSMGIKESTTASMKIDSNDVIVRDNPPTKIKLPFQSARTLGTNVEKGKRIGSGGYVTTPFNMFSTLQKDQLEYENETVHNFQENCSSAARKLSKNKNSKEEAVNMTEQNNRTCNSVTRNEKSEFVNTKPNNILVESSTFMERPDHPQGMYGWGWTQELGVICQGCAALSGLGGDVQQAVFDFGRAIPLIKQMKWNGDLDLDLEDKYLTRLESFLGDFPDCANKRLLVSLCRNYVLQSNE